MMTVETIGRICRAYFVERESIRGIARRLRVSRQVVRRAIASETGEFHYERSVQPLPKLGSHLADLKRLLEENERRPRRERVTLIQIWEELRALGYAGGYDAVRRYARRWQRGREAAKPLRPTYRSYLHRGRPISSIGVTRSSNWPA